MIGGKHESIHAISGEVMKKGKTHGGNRKHHKEANQRKCKKKERKKKPTEHAMMTQFVICTNPINELPRGFANVFADQSELVLRVGAGKDGPAPNELR